MAERVVIESPYAIKADAEADAFIMATAEKAIAEHCTSCHGADLHGKPGVPDLVDYEFIGGVTGEETSDVGPVTALEQTIRYGVRNQDCPVVHDQATRLDRRRVDLRWRPPHDHGVDHGRPHGPLPRVG